MASRTCAVVTGASNFTCSSVPPVKSRPRFRPFTAMDAAPAAISRAEKPKNMNRLLMKSMLVFFISTIIC